MNGVYVGMYHRPYDGGTYIARYRIANYYIEGKGDRISEALRDLADQIESGRTDQYTIWQEDLDNE